MPIVLGIQWPMRATIYPTPRIIFSIFIMKKIIITGHKGIIGTVLTNGLSKLSHEYEIKGLDLPETDMTDFDMVKAAIAGSDAVIHLAWDTTSERIGSGRMDPANSQMFFNVYRAALDLERNRPRVIMASSVHADEFRNHETAALLSPHDLPIPNGPYGASKVHMEALGRYFATQGLEVVCIRFGGVSPTNDCWKGPKDELVYLHHEDCISLIKTILEAPVVPNNFAILYGISDNAGRIHDISNPFGWVPEHGLR